MDCSQVCPTTEMYRETVYLWIFDSRPLLMNLNLSFLNLRIMILIVVVCKFYFAFIQGFLVKHVFFSSLLLQ